MRKSVIGAALTAGMGATAAYGQSDEPFQLNTIILETASENSVEVSEEDIARQNPTDIKDLYKSQPTIAVGSSIPASQKLYVNGVEETNLAVTIDGGRQNNKIFHHNATTLIDPALLKAVRIEPGVAAADSGPGALAGAVAYETRDVGDLLEGGKSFGGMVKGEYDSNGKTFSTSGSAYGRVGGFEYLGYLKVADGDLHSDGSGADITGSGTNLLSGLAKIAYQTDAGDRFELSYESVKDDEARPYRANIGLIVGGRPVPLTRPYNLARQNLVFTYTDETPEGWWDPKISFAYSVTDLKIDESTSSSYGTTDSFNGTLQNRFALAKGSITAGLDFYSDSAELTYTTFGPPVSSDYTKEKLRNIGLFAQARLEPTDRTRLSFGLRSDHQNFTGVDGSKFSDSGISGNLSGELDVTSALTLSAGYSKVWGGTPLAENFIHNTAWVYPASGIEAVTSENVFVGARAQFGNWDLSGKLFRTKIDNARAASWSGGPALTADMESEGFELGLGYTWGSGFARIGYANIDTTVNGNPADSYTGNYLTTPIGEVVTLELGHTFAQHGLTLGADAQIVLKETNTYLTSSGTAGLPLPSYEVVNAFVEWQPKRYSNLTLRGEITNLFDQTYASRATYGQEFASVQPLKEPGRSLKISAMMKF